MGTRTTKKLYEQVLSEEVVKLFAPLGFVETDSGAFARSYGKVMHGFGFTPNPSFTHFHVPIGAYVPSIEKRCDYINGAHYSALLVSRWLGEFKEKFTSHDYNFHFATVEQLREKMPQVYADFVEQAEPWLATLITVDDMAREFHKWRIEPPAGGHTRPPDPFAWAIYGWVLQEDGRIMEARPWLERAYDFLRQPEHLKAGRLVPRTLPGSRPISLRAEDARLLELLEKDLEIQ